ncbi:hypothetical protein L1I30_14030 [Gillisia sp. M10.2A]|uniref:Uncharacterized protein n=1 Tax=Gillisia lutea TaxID=2909668 RepID=A0ABS9EJ25_9FLAO|nr:hypothetical protein [Gillisia lutea]MCF4102793.1 hypothetical protein [Gillisia lutea]
MEANEIIPYAILSTKNQLIMMKKYSQLINTLLILVGGIMLVYSITVETPDKYIQIGGFVVIMFGLYRATNYWVETKDDHIDDNEQQDL